MKTSLLRNPAVFAWCLYDLANTIFAMNMTSYHFPVWVVSDRGGQELHYSAAFGISMLASALVMPRLGAESDRSGGRVPAMVLWTLGCVALTAALTWIPNLAVALTAFALANFCYQLAGVFYNALLPAISRDGQMGRISGYGVALGYVGTLIGILATAPVAARWGRQATFLPTALLFLVLALPSFFLVREKREKESGTSSQVGGLAGSARTDHPVTLSVSKGDRGNVRSLLRPLLAPALIGLGALGTVILFMSVYAKQAIGLTDAELQRFLTLATLVTIGASFLWGRATDRWGGFRTLRAVWVVWILVFGLATVTLDERVFLLIGCLAGTALGGTWVASRVLLVQWVGPARIGEAFGLFGLISRLSAVAGPMLWAGLLWLCKPMGSVRYQLGMGVLFLCMALGAWRFCRLRPPAVIKLGTQYLFPASE